jgi:hypothetical protein
MGSVLRAREEDSSCWSAAGREHQKFDSYATGVGAGLIVAYGGCVASTTGTITVA